VTPECGLLVGHFEDFSDNLLLCLDVDDVSPSKLEWTIWKLRHTDHYLAISFFSSNNPFPEIMQAGLHIASVFSRDLRTIQDAAVLFEFLPIKTPFLILFLKM